jgi:hypothetical protein
MLDFKPISIEDKEEIQKFLSIDSYKACDMGFQNMFLWRRQYEFRFCVEDDFFFFRSHGDDGECCYYKFPLGRGDVAQAIERLIAHTKAKGHGLRLFALTEQMKKRLEKACPGRFEYTENRDAADYIYLSESLASLSGKKFHSKRNFINRFYVDYGDRLTVEPIDSSDLSELREFHAKWAESMEGDSDLDKESYAVEQAFDHYDALELHGLILRVGGNIVAFSFGSQLTPDTFDVHVEKADTGYSGAYNVINNLMAKEFGSKYKYFNREEDVGLEGLRRAKLSYQPEIILHRWNATLKGE